MNLIIQEPQPGDIGWLIATHGLAYSQQYNFDADFEVDIARKVISFLESQHHFNRIFIAHADGKRAGSIAVSIRPDNSAFINFLLVKMHHRSLGVAQHLMDNVLSHATEHGAQYIRLETYSCLQDARKLYKKYGFTMHKKNPGMRKYGQIFDQEFWEKKLNKTK